MERISTAWKKIECVGTCVLNMSIEYAGYARYQTSCNSRSTLSTKNFHDTELNPAAIKQSHNFRWIEGQQKIKGSHKRECILDGKLAMPVLMSPN